MHWEESSQTDSGLMEEPLTTRPTTTVLKFGNKKHASLEVMIFQIPVSEYHFADVKAEIADVDIPFLPGLDVIKIPN